MKKVICLYVCFALMSSGTLTAKRKQRVPDYVMSLCDTNRAKWIFEDGNFLRVYNNRQYIVADPSGLWVYKRLEGYRSPFPPLLLMFFLLTVRPVYSYHFSLGQCDTVRELNKGQLNLVFSKNKGFLDTLEKVQEEDLRHMNRRTKRTVLNNLYLSTLSEAAVKRE